MIRQTSVALMLAAALAACGGTSSTSSATAAPAATTSSPTVAKNASYASAAELRDAVLAAGGSCPTFHEQTDAIEAFSQADCDDETVLSIFPTDAAKDRIVETFKGTADVIGMNILVGPNWIVNAPADMLNTISPTLGGVLMVQDAPN